MTCDWQSILDEDCPTLNMRFGQVIRDCIWGASFQIGPFSQLFVLYLRPAASNSISSETSRIGSSKVICLHFTSELPIPMKFWVHTGKGFVEFFQQNKIRLIADKRKLFFFTRRKLGFCLFDMRNVFNCEKMYVLYHKHFFPQEICESVRKIPLWNAS